MEKEKARQLVETVEEAKPTPTRALQPQDLKIVQSKMVLETKADGEQSSQSARHEIEIHNSGNVPYKGIQLKFVYLSRSGKALQTKTHSITHTVLPGATLKLADINVNDISSSVAGLQTTVIYADIGSSNPSNQ